MTTPSLNGFTVGSVIADTYQLTRLIGQGGMGAVWEANHLRLPGKRVAVKMLLQGANDPHMLARFRREAEIASRLGHPNIVQILDFNTLPDGVPYIVLELLLGENLSDRLGRGPMNIAHVQAVVRQIGSALQAAHREGIVHRDLKPENIFLCPTEIGGERHEIAKVLDFGISKMRDARTALTQGAAIMGTPRYMAPEQAMGHNDDIDARTDIFSFGAVVYEMMGGRPAFGGDSLAAVVHAVVYAPTPPLASIAPTVPPAIAAAVDRALAKNAAERFPDVASFVSAVTGRSLETASGQAAVSGTDSTQMLSAGSVSPGGATFATGATAMGATGAARAAGGAMGVGGTMGVGATRASQLSSASIPPTATDFTRQEPARPRKTLAIVLGLAVMAGVGAGGVLLLPRLTSTGGPTNAGEAKPGEAKPPEAKPPEAKPPEAKPPEAKPADEKPAPPKTEAIAKDAPDGPTSPGRRHEASTHAAPKSKPEKEGGGAPLAAAAAAELNEAETALAGGKTSEAIRLAQHSLYTQKSSRAYSLMARARCIQGDLGNAKAAFAQVQARDRAAVQRACRTHNVDLR